MKPKYLAWAAVATLVTAGFVAWWATRPAPDQFTARMVLMLLAGVLFGPGLGVVALAEAEGEVLALQGKHRDWVEPTLAASLVAGTLLSLVGVAGLILLPGSEEPRLAIALGTLLATGAAISRVRIRVVLGRYRGSTDASERN